MHEELFFLAFVVLEIIAAVVFCILYFGETMMVVLYGDEGNVCEKVWRVEGTT